MNSLCGRLKNAFETGGINEVIRKLYWKVIYSRKAKKIRLKIENKQLEYGVCKASKRPYQVIVSLTTYPARFENIQLCLKSLILQSEKPDHIIVYLGKDSANVELPQNMKIFEKYGVEFKYDINENLGSHKKYYYAMKEYPSAVVVTADDDIIYPDDWLKSLLYSYKKYPDCISARRVHLMQRDKNGRLKKYNHWIDQYRKELNPSNAIIATGNAGVLYPPNSLDERAFDIEAIKKYCFEADDIWLKCMAILKGTKYIWVPNDVVDLPEVDCVGKMTLSKENVVQNKNDKYLKNVMEHYKIHDELFFN